MQITRFHFIKKLLETFDSFNLIYISLIFLVFTILFPNVFNISQPLQFPPRLALEGYNGFNIIIYRNKYYSVPQTLGEISQLNEDESILNKCLHEAKCGIANSLKEVMVDQQVIPQLIEKDYRGFKIIAYQDNFFVMARTLGSVNLTELDKQRMDEYKALCAEYNVCGITDSLEGAKQLVDRLTGKNLEN
jgi:hypothetical protein